MVTGPTRLGPVLGNLAQALRQRAMTMPEHLLPGLAGTDAMAVLGDPNATDEKVFGGVIGLREQADVVCSARVPLRQSSNHMSAYAATLDVVLEHR